MWRLYIKLNWPPSVQPLHLAGPQPTSIIHHASWTFENPSRGEEGKIPGLPLWQVRFSRLIYIPTTRPLLPKKEILIILDNLYLGACMFIYTTQANCLLYEIKYLMDTLILCWKMMVQVYLGSSLPVPEFRGGGQII